MADEMLEVVRALDPDLEFKCNKFYIGLAKGGQPNNFVIFRPKKGWLRLEVRLERPEETQAQLDGCPVSPSRTTTLDGDATESVLQRAT